MKTLIRILITVLFLTLLFSQMSCRGVYWGEYKHTASGKHYKQEYAWPYRQHCIGVHHGQYIKQSTVRRYHFTRH